MPRDGIGARGHWLIAASRAEVVLAVLAVSLFLGFLGAPELWGKREQRAAAETLDTVQSGHWLVARIQGRPRLEKPPLPRWALAGLILATGRSDEAMVRLPNALAALGTIALVVALGRRVSGREAGLAAGFALASSLFFVFEMRQAGNDGPLTFFTALAVYAAWRRLHGDGAESPADGAEPGPPGLVPGGRGWAVLMGAALGLGFLCKGPVILLIFGLTMVPYLAWSRRLGPGLRALGHPLGLVLMVALAASWPVPVALFDPRAVEVWTLEMGQKAGTAGISHHQDRAVLALNWFWMTAPWTVLATLAVGRVAARACRRRRDGGRALTAGQVLGVSWTAANLMMFSLWAVAKPNYFLPCLPGVALLVGLEWNRLARHARDGAEGRAARWVLRSHWVALFAVAAVGPLAVAWLQPAFLPWAVAGSAVMMAGVLGSQALWRRGGFDPAALGALVASLALVLPVGFALAARHENASRGHKALARTLDRILPPEARRLAFFHELDEGLWFYLRGRELTAVPGSTPRYNDGFDLLQNYRDGKTELVFDPAARLAQQKKVLIDWLARPDRGTEYVLVRGKVFDLMAPDLAGRAEVVFRERDVRRNDLVLLRAATAVSATAARPESSSRR
jgi:4-amino-4-deoxy-L-arabinose transferase-like glycosyltransferase